MKASKFTDAQKPFIINQGEDGTTVAEICRKAGISSATYFNKKKYAGMLPTEMKRPAQRLQRRTTAWREREQSPGGADEIARRIQLVCVIKSAENLDLTGDTFGWHINKPTDSHHK